MMLAVRNTITCARRKDLECNAEALFCEVRLDSKRKFLIAVFYRPPDSRLEYMKEHKKSLRSGSGAHFDQIFYVVTLTFQTSTGQLVLQQQMTPYVTVLPS